MGQSYEMGINIGPSISYRTSAQSGDPIAVSIQNGEEGIYTFDFGLDLRRSISDKTKVGIGIWYSQKGMSNTNVGITYDDLSLFTEVVQIGFKLLYRFPEGRYHFPGDNRCPAN